MTSTLSSARNSSTVRSATRGEPGHRVDHGLGRHRHRRGDQLFDDGGIDLLEGRRGLVEVVEGVQSSERRGGGVAGGPHVGVRRRQERRSVVGQELGAGGPEAHHGDVGAGRHAQPLNGLVDADAGADACASFADAFNTSVGSGREGDER